MSKPLYLKMGIKEGCKVAVIHPPEDFATFFSNVPFEITWSEDPSEANLVHFFPKNISNLEEKLFVLQDQIDKEGMIWVSWFKKASKIPTDIDEDIIRDTALNLKLVDVKVCSVSDQYSALKLVIRKHLR
ncbi:MAG: DUF3052 domain-containing protein [Bacteroidia bacterium]|nr:DUF3052 domain-containing protein [Bacteroidia bacterium]